MNASADASKTFENHQDHPLRQWVIRATCVFSYLYYRISHEITHRGIRRTKVPVMQLALLALINVELLPERQSSVSTDIRRESSSWTRDIPFEFLHRCIKKHSLYEDFLKVLYIYFIISLLCTSFIVFCNLSLIFESRNYYILHWLKKN